MKNTVTEVTTSIDDTIRITYFEFAEFLTNGIPETVKRDLYISVLPNIENWGIDMEVTSWIKSQIINDPRLYNIDEGTVDGMMMELDSMLFGGLTIEDPNRALVVRSRIIESIALDLTQKERNILKLAPDSVELDLILRSNKKWPVWEIINQYTCPDETLLDPVEPFRWLAIQLVEFDKIVLGGKVER